MSEDIIEESSSTLTLSIVAYISSRVFWCSNLKKILNNFYINKHMYVFTLKYTSL